MSESLVFTSNERQDLMQYTKEKAIQGTLFCALFSCLK